LQVGDLTLHGVPRTHALATGAEVSAFTRPEDVVVRLASDELPNSTVGRIEHIEFLGAFCRLTICLDGAAAQRLYADFSLRGLRSLGLEAGAAVRVALPGERVRVFGKQA
jgi:iron(III) transport system ATP-binding protein